MAFAIRNLEKGCSDIVKLCLKNSINIGEYNKGNNKITELRTIL